MKSWWVLVVLVACGGQGIDARALDDDGPCTGTDCPSAPCAASFAKSELADFTDLALTPSGDVVVLDELSGLGARITAYAGNGERRWRRELGAGSQGVAVVANPAGGVFVAGNVRDATLDLGRGVLLRSDQRGDAVVLALDAHGVTTWATPILDAGPANATSYGSAVTGLSVGPDGQPVAIGTFGSSLGVGGFTFSSTSAVNLWLARFDATTGGPTWVVDRATAVTAPDLLDRLSVAVSTQAIHIAGVYDGELVIGDATLASGTRDLFWARFDLAGAAQTSRAFAVNGNVELHALSRGPSGGVYLVGALRGEAVFEQTLASQGDDYDGFVLRLDANGEPAASFVMGGERADRTQDVTYDDGGAWLTGYLSGVVVTPSGSVGRPGLATGFVARLDDAEGIIALDPFLGSASHVGRRVRSAAAGCIAVGGVLEGGSLTIDALAVGSAEGGIATSFVAQVLRP